ncbi:SDR family NAD(P)-dependent oxidoreductase [Mycobacterium sp. MS1601]|uniref:SDR family NAD(P)-dependent oxidoreductase n=1 Tax=Mycobacterium sp. MS1601 TaxID=1936029 RepID=UPI0018D35B39|nr:SDR family NAD(P)-dependent oxidoreductase [Mycobacterium sp. MS1601]
MQAVSTEVGRVQGKVAAVTGAADGIGRAIADMLARHGAAVAILDRNAEAAHAVAADITDRGGQAMAVTVDVSVEESVAEAMSLIWQRWGALHVLVNNAGVSGPAESADAVDFDAWKAMFAVNVDGPFLCTKHAIGYLRQTQGGRSIINMSSIYGLIGNSDAPSYHAAKGAVRLMAKTDAVTYAPEGIRVNAVCPGTIMTPFNIRKGESYPGGLKAYLREMSAMHPIGHVGEPDDIAYGVLYLASDESRFVTGTELIIDGGYTAQ